MAAKKKEEQSDRFESMEDALRYIEQLEAQLVAFDKARSSQTEDLSPTFMNLGQPYLFRTVTHYYVGKVLGVSAPEILLGNTIWVPETGIFSECLKTGQLGEVEPYPDRCILNRNSVVDASPWLHAIPRARRQQ